MNKAGIYLLLVFPLLLNSCSLQKYVQGKFRHRHNPDSTSVSQVPEHRYFIYPQPDTAEAVNDTAGAAMQLMAAVAQLWANKPVYQTFSAKAKKRESGSCSVISKTPKSGRGKLRSGEFPSA